MKIQLVNITDRHSAVTVDVCTGEFIPKQYLLSLRVKVCFIDITDTDSAVTVDIAHQVYLHILRHRIRSHCNCVLPGNMILLANY